LTGRRPSLTEEVSVTIHSSHPFLPPEGERDPVRRLRGRLAAPVTLWTAGHESRPAGLPVSSVLVAAGEPNRVLGLCDPDSDLYDAIQRSGAFAVIVLGWQHRVLADAFAGVSPAPGGPFRLAEWSATEWGPVLAEPVTWAGCRVESEPRPFGWGHLVTAVIEQVQLADDEPAPMAYRRGRYLPM
jgi:3-hydroxy-9,10-secoandrosta-1,3,5(10)-triene-9,17-dione monooxygenase reductase component